MKDSDWTFQSYQLVISQFEKIHIPKEPYFVTFENLENFEILKSAAFSPSPPPPTEIGPQLVVPVCHFDTFWGSFPIPHVNLIYPAIYSIQAYYIIYPHCVWMGLFLVLISCTLLWGMYHLGAWNESRKCWDDMSYACPTSVECVRQITHLYCSWRPHGSPPALPHCPSGHTTSPRTPARLLRLAAGQGAGQDGEVGCTWAGAAGTTAGDCVLGETQPDQRGGGGRGGGWRSPRGVAAMPSAACVYNVRSPRGTARPARPHNPLPCRANLTRKWPPTDQSQTNPCSPNTQMCFCADPC